MSVTTVQIADIEQSDALSRNHRSSMNGIDEWRPIPGSDGLYSVSSYGRVRSEPIQTSRVGRRRGRVLKCYPNSKGYFQFRMSLRDRAVTMKVHRAVALAFLGPRPCGAQINHKSGDKRDNSVRNLEYVSGRRNVQHSWEAGLCSVEHRRGERSVIAKLTPDAVREIRRRHENTTLSDLARRFGVTKQCIHQVITGKTWRHVA
jgi:hypothetical protein